MRANGTANLFLLNPNGIVFGPNASLNVGGSFVATTANAIQFGNAGFFSASNPNNPALLTVNPSALFFNQIAAASNPNISTTATNLSVRDGQGLFLVGGNINIDSGRLNAFGGRVELAGLAVTTCNTNRSNLHFPVFSLPGLNATIIVLQPGLTATFPLIICNQPAIIGLSQD